MTRHILDIRLLAMPPSELPFIGVGIRGVMMPDGDELVIPIINAEIEGIGLLSTFLDELPKHKTIRFECVINPGFAAGLMQRGYEWDGDDLILRPK